MTLHSPTSYKLVNFNVPTHVINSFDQLVRYKGVSRTSLLLRLIDDFMRSEQRLLKEDNNLTKFINSVKTEERETTKKTLVDDYEPPMVPSFNDDYDWEERLRSL